MKLLVTGGSGFIGSRVSRFFSTQRNEVVVFDNISRADLLNNSFGDPLFNWNELKLYQNVTLVRGDIRDFESIRKACEGVDAIIHTAAQVAVTVSMTNPRTDFETNALGTFNVLEAARVNDVASLILTSTNKVYGENVNKIPVAERKTRYEFSDSNFTNGIPETFSTDHTGHSPYGCSKLAADMYAQDYSDSYGLRTGVFRMSCIYGDKQFGVEDQGWVAWFTIATLLGKPLTIFGDGKQVRDVLFVDDLVRACEMFLQNGNLRGTVFNIGGGPSNTISLLELLEILKELTDITPDVRYSEWRRADQKVYISNIEKAQRLLGWTPIVSPSEGIRRLVSWALNYYGHKHASGLS